RNTLFQKNGAPEIPRHRLCHEKNACCAEWNSSSAVMRLGVRLSLCYGVATMQSGLGASDEEMEAARHVIENAFLHPLLKRARSSLRCCQEFPVRRVKGVPRRSAGEIGYLSSPNREFDFWNSVSITTCQFNYHRPVLAGAKVPGSEATAN